MIINENELLEIFEEVLKTSYPPEELNREETEEWDSLTHIKLIISLERKFKIKISQSEISDLYSDFQTVLDYLNNLEK